MMGMRPISPAMSIRGSGKGAGSMLMQRKGLAAAMPMQMMNGVGQMPMKGMGMGMGKMNGMMMGMNGMGMKKMGKTSGPRLD